MTEADPLIDKLLEKGKAFTAPEDLGIYFNTEVRVQNFCKNQNLDKKAETILWFVASTSRKCLEGCVAADNHARFRKDLEGSSAAHDARSVFPLCGPPEKAFNMSGPVQKVKTTLNKMFNMDGSGSTDNLDTGKGDNTLGAREVKVRKKVHIQCLKMLFMFGSDCSLFREIYGNGKRQPSEIELKMLDKLFFSGSDGRKIKPQTVSQYSKDLIGLVRCLSALGVPISEATPFLVAAYLNDTGNRGKSVPIRVLNALIWAENVFRFNLHTKEGIVKANATDPVLGKIAPTKPARCPNKEMVINMEKATTDRSENTVVRVFAGLCACLTHGTLRWSDFQRSKVTLGEDAILGEGEMKRVGQRAWACPRKGFSGLDWGSDFTELIESEMKGSNTKDFVLYKPNSTFTGFTDQPCTYDDALNAIRAVLCKVCKMHPSEACTYTLHSWRHFYPSAARQRRMTEEEQCAIGHWSKGSKMPEHYDSVVSTIEMAAKEAIIKFFRSGGDLVEAGRFPMPNPLCDVPLPEKVILVGPQNKVQKFDQSTLPVQVVYTVADRVHLYHPKVSVRRTICSLYACGTPMAPTKYACFCEAWNSRSPTGEWEFLCGSCYTEPYLKKLPVRGPLQTKNEIALACGGPDFYVEDSEAGSEVSSSSSSSSSFD